MMRLRLLLLSLIPVLAVLPAFAQTQTAAPRAPERTIGHPPIPAPQDPVGRYVRVPSGPVILLQHLRVMDGTLTAPLLDQTIRIEAGKITAIGPASAADEAPSGATVLDLTGRTAFPGLVGMHDHIFYIARPNLDPEGHSEPPLVVPELPFSSPHLYLGAGVTTLRTTGSVEPYTDLNLRSEIDRGRIPGPHLDVTGPYLEGPHSPFLQMHQLKDAADARATVDFWAAQGVTSFKAYMNITRDELAAAVQEAHKLGFKITGHLCAVTYPEAVAAGIDNLEHGFWVNTQLDPGKQPDLCPSTVGAPTLAAMAPDSQAARDLIALLVSHHVALTSTLPVFESSDPHHLQLQDRVLAAMEPNAREAYLYTRNLELSRPSPVIAGANPPGLTRAGLLRREMDLERAFVAAGGLLLAGPDPTGDGGVLPGFGDQREIELLVDAGFTPVEALHIATFNGAEYMGRLASIGTLTAGKNADLVIVRGDPSMHIEDIEKTEIIFKDGVGYDSKKLLDSALNRYGQY